MKNFGIVYRKSMLLIAMLLAALVVGCGSGEGENGGAIPNPNPPTAAGAGTGVNGAGRGPAPVPLGLAGEFAALSAHELENTGNSRVTGNAGSTYASGADITLPCDQVVGTIYKRDRSGPGCMQQALAYLTDAKADGDVAFNDSMARVPDYTGLDGGEIGGRNLGPATYRWDGRVYVRSDLTLTGGPNDVWIFQITEQLDVSPGVRIHLRGGARAENVFWAPTFTVTLAENSHFEGILLPAAPVLMLNGSSITGRLLAEGIQLDSAIVTQP